MSMEDLSLIHDRLRHLARAAGGRIEGFLVCPHVPEARCECRKPAPGLLVRARDAYGLDLEGAVFIGDHETDVMAAQAVGMSSVLVLTGRTARGVANGHAAHIVDDLAAAAAVIIDSRQAVAAAS
jgi:D-glycero-D-manno-heptose 1,7-bisphosphate phosphatase